MRTEEFTALGPAPPSHLHEAKKVLLPVLSVWSEAQQSPKPHVYLQSLPPLGFVLKDDT